MTLPLIDSKIGEEIPRIIHRYFIVIIIAFNQFHHRHVLHLRR